MSNTSLITGATLLSVGEAKQVPEDIREFNGWWWLRSPGYDTTDAAYVMSSGCVYMPGDYVDYGNGSVRPALQLNSDISNLKDGDRIKVGKYEFDVVCGGKYALCTKATGKSIFREDRKAKDANIYEASDVKKIVDEWFKNEIKDIDVEMATYTKIGVA